MNKPISPGIWTYATKNGQRYRLFGLVRGNDSDSDAANALAIMGLASLTYYPQGSQLPSDWPTDEPKFQLSSDERLFRAEGTWTKNDPMPTATSAGKGSVIIYMLWEYTPAAQPISGPMSSSNGWLYIGGALILAGVAGAYFLSRKPMLNPTGRPEVNREGLTFIEWLHAAHLGRALPPPGDPALRALRKAWRDGEDPTEYAQQENPKRYDTTVMHMGVPIHVHTTDGGVCADYSAIDMLLKGAGGEVCGSSRDYVIDEAKRRVEVLYVRAQHQNGFLPPAVRKPRRAPSPWD